MEVNKKKKRQNASFQFIPSISTICSKTNGIIRQLDFSFDVRENPTVFLDLAQTGQVDPESNSVRVVSLDRNAIDVGKTRLTRPDRPRNR